MNTDRTANANLAPRCRHIKMNGQPCCAPARRNRRYCVFHEAAHTKRPDYQVRLVEDAMSLQFALFQVMRTLDDHEVDTKRAALKLYALQIAASNLKRLQQEIDYNPADDPARDKSLLEMLLDQLQIPHDEDGNDIPPDQLAAYGVPPVAHLDESPIYQPPAASYQQAIVEDRQTDDPQPGDPQPGDRFTIQACASHNQQSSESSPKTRRRRPAEKYIRHRCAGGLGTAVAPDDHTFSQALCSRCRARVLVVIWLMRATSCWPCRAIL